MPARLIGIGAVFAFVVSLAGCQVIAPAPAPRHEPLASKGTEMTIELLGFPGCPNTPTMRENLRAALGPGHERAFADVNQEALPESDPRRGWPTPTILVNGEDLFGMSAPNAPAIGCRIYPSGVPSVSEIGIALKAAGGVSRGL